MSQTTNNYNKRENYNNLMKIHIYQLLLSITVQDEHVK